VASAQAAASRDGGGAAGAPGIGAYTAAAIASIAFDRRAVVMDGNVERVVARAQPRCRTRCPRQSPELRVPDLMRYHPSDLTAPATFAQAMM
jgi:A/G-specific adenine glycosylase